MKKLMTAVAAIALLAGIGMTGANAATRLTDTQLDHVTAGGGLFIFDGTTAHAGSGASAFFGFAKSESGTASFQIDDADVSVAGSKAVAAGVGVHAGSGASSSAGFTLAVH